jgi:hypothetical protein
VQEQVKAQEQTKAQERIAAQGESAAQGEAAVEDRAAVRKESGASTEGSTSPAREDKPRPGKSKRASREMKRATRHGRRLVTESSQRRSNKLIYIMTLLVFLAMVGIAMLWKATAPGEDLATRGAPHSPVRRTAADPAPDKAGAGTVEPQRGEEGFDVIEEEEAAPVKIHLRSQPPGARILIDDEDTKLTTPAWVEGLTSTEEVKITLDLPGRRLHHMKLTPAEGMRLIARLDKRSRRWLQISSVPRGATVLLNSFKIGKTPLVLKRKMRPRSVYWIRFEAEGYNPEELKIIPEELAWKRDGDDELAKMSIVMVKRTGGDEPAGSGAGGQGSGSRAPAAAGTTAPPDTASAASGGGAGGSATAGEEKGASAGGGAGEPAGGGGTSGRAADGDDPKLAAPPPPAAKPDAPETREGQEKAAPVPKEKKTSSPAAP